MKAHYEMELPESCHSCQFYMVPVCDCEDGKYFLGLCYLTFTCRFLTRNGEHVDEYANERAPFCPLKTGE